MRPSSYDWNRYTIQDPVHGGIRYGPIEKTVIDHRLFQRLHGLRQNSLLHLIFPSANHTRFDHSVGVMHLAGRFLDSILANQRVVIDKGAKRRSTQDGYRVDDDRMRQTVTMLERNDYPRLVIRVAALLHDTGHGPFSHLFDRFFPPMSFVQDKLGKSRRYREISSEISDSPRREVIKHDMMSCVIATKIVNDIAADITDDLRPLGASASQLAKDVRAVIHTKFSPSEKLVESYPHDISRLLHEVVASNIDADRMDYLLRDSHMCGINYGRYDPDRILKSMCAYEDVRTGLLHIGVRYSGLGALEDLLVSRYLMHSQIYGHKTNRACAAMLDEIHDKLKASAWTWYGEPATIDEFLRTFCKLSDSSLVARIRREGNPQVRSLLTQLMDRKLIKRTFEGRVAEPGEAKDRNPNIKARWKKHQDRMEKKAIWFKKDEFPIKGLGLDDPKETLKVLRKHPQRGFYLVHELKEFSTIVRYLPPEEVIYRNYCRKSDVENGKKLVPTARSKGADFAATGFPACAG